MELADRFDLPVISLVDTPGAWPGIDAEERGQAEAIARATDAGLALGTPSVAVIVGEGGSGGALAIAASNKVLMLEHSIYTVASPEAAASILWRDSSRAQDAATNMKITAADLSGSASSTASSRSPWAARIAIPRRRWKRPAKRSPGRWNRSAICRATSCETRGPPNSWRLAARFSAALLHADLPP